MALTCVYPPYLPVAGTKTASALCSSAWVWVGLATATPPCVCWSECLWEHGTQCVCLMALPVAVQGCGGQEGEVYVGICCTWVPVPVGVCRVLSKCCWCEPAPSGFVQICNILCQHVSDYVHLSVGRQCQRPKKQPLGNSGSNPRRPTEQPGARDSLTPVPGPSWLHSEPGQAFPALLSTPPTSEAPQDEAPSP